MKAYYLVFFLTLLFSLFIEAKTDKQWRWKLFWTFLPLFIYGAIRVDYGNDYSSYEELFNLIHGHSDFDLDRDLHAELGYQLLNKIIPSYRLLLVLSAFILSFSLGVFCCKNIPQKYLWLAIILIFLNPEKNVFGVLVGIRNGLVISSFILLSDYIHKRKWLPFMAFTVALSYIHTSALFYLPIAYFVGFNKPFKTKEIWIWCAALLALITVSMTDLSRAFFAFIENDIFARYETYLYEEMQRGVLIVGVSVVNIVLLLFYFSSRGYALSESENSMIRLGILYSAMFFLGSLSMRASYFYDMFYIGSIITIVNDKRAKLWLRLSIVSIAIVTSIYSMFIVWMGAPSWSHSIYHSLLGSW